MKEILKAQIQNALKALGINSEHVLLEHPADVSHGDYSTNVAMAHAKALGKNPRALAEEIVAKLSENKIPEIGKIDIAGPGFINFHLSKDFFENSLKEVEESKKWGSSSISGGKKVMVEYTDPNPFKPFHIGHLMTNAIGESVARIFEYSGANVVRANYQGDVGLHVAKAIWMLLKKGKGDTSLSVEKQAEYIGACYSEASNLYEEDASVKVEIDAINKKVYEKSDAQINEMYDWGREVTLQAFETIYKTLGTKFNNYFFESVMAPIGKEIVEKNIGKVFTESDGAVVFRAEEHDPKLHTRVFITKQGLPTYETKEIGLTTTKFTEVNPDFSIVVTAIEQGPYMEVVQKAISIMHPDYASRMKHLTHGMMRFASGKMSSRKGNVITGELLLNETRDLVHEKIKDKEFSNEEKNALASKVAVSAIKYTILKQALGGNIIYDEEKSISFEGDSGPYLQYTAVRAGAVLVKGKQAGINLNSKCPSVWDITTLEKLIYRFPEVVERSYELLEPHHIAVYLTELASAYNSFYGQNLIINMDDIDGSGYRLALTEAFRTTMINGLYLLGIEVPERM